MVTFSELGIPEEEGSSYLKELGKNKYPIVMKVSGGCITEEDITHFRYSLGCLIDFGVIPVIVHGAGEKISRTLEEEGIPTQWVNGLRYTDKRTLDVVVKTVKKENARFVRELNNGKIIAQGFNSGFFAERMGEEYGSYVGKVTDINVGTIDECLNNRQAPVLSSLGIDNLNRGYLNTNADDGAEVLVGKLPPGKVIFLTLPGCIFDGDGEPISRMTQKELEDFIDNGYATGGMNGKLRTVLRMLEKHDVQITSPKDLLYEIFTDKGKGTYITKG